MCKKIYPQSIDGKYIETQLPGEIQIQQAIVDTVFWFLCWATAQLEFQLVLLKWVVSAKNYSNNNKVVKLMDATVIDSQH